MAQLALCRCRIACRLKSRPALALKFDAQEANALLPRLFAQLTSHAHQAIQNALMALADQIALTHRSSNAQLVKSLALKLASVLPAEHRWICAHKLQFARLTDLSSASM